MDLPEIGGHCAFCQNLDLLPITCPNCSKILCRHHIHAHDCSAQPNNTSPPKEAHNHQQLPTCQLEGCGNYTLDRMTTTPIVCKCHKAFCVQHRHPDTHACEAPSEAAPQNEKARELLLKHFGPAKSRAAPGSAAARLAAAKPVKVPTDPAKLQRFLQVEKIKMRHRAIPGDPKVSGAPLEDRVHISVDLGEGKDPRVFWFRKSIITGRALDLLSSSLNISGSGSTLLGLAVLTVKDGVTEQIGLRNDKELGQQVEDGSIVVITKTTSTGLIQP